MDFLLCTDGVSGVLDLLALERVLQRVSMQQVVNELVDTAFEKSTDNLTRNGSWGNSPTWL